MIETTVRLPILEPMLVSERRLPIQQSGWAYEVKWDGHRTLAYCDGTEPARLISREGNDATIRYPELSVGIGEMMRGIDAIIDGEVVCFDERGRPSLRILNDRCFPFTNRIRPGAARAVFVAFDLLWFKGTELAAWSYEARRAILGKLPLVKPLVIVPPAWDNGEVAMRYTKEAGLEGIVAKKLSSPYWPGQRSGNWIKHRHHPFTP